MSRPVVSLPNNWTPRWYQVPLWRYLHSGGKRASAVWHRRAGKDELCLHWTACAAHQRIGNYWHMLPEAAQARKALWDAINPHTGVKRIDEAFPPEIRRRTLDQQMQIEFNSGSIWQVLGSDNYNSLVGSPPIGLVFSEWALADPSAWAMLRPILLENGGWALFIGTPRGNNHAKRTHDLAGRSDHWFGQLLTAEDTGVFDAEQLDMEREELIAQYDEDIGKAMFLQEYYCSFSAAIVGAVFGKVMRDLHKQGRINDDVTHVPGLPVHTFWDIGIHDPTAITFAQKDGIHWRIIDFWSATDGDMAGFAQVLEDKRKANGYVYGAHIGPHDLEKREYSGQKVVDLASDLGIHFEVVPRMSKMDSIMHLRKFLPTCWIHKTKCGHLVDALEQHRYKWDDQARRFGLQPIHDWTSHPVDSAKTGACAPSYAFSRTWEDDQSDWGGSTADYLDELDRCAI